MKRYLIIRLFALLPLWLGISVLAFGLGQLAPGDAAIILAQQLSDVPPSVEQIAAVRRDLQLDAPWPVRYGRWLARAVRGDLGLSYRTREPVLARLAAKFPATLYLACCAFALALAVALPLGTLAAVKRGTWVDHLARGAALGGASLPNYWLGYLLVLVFAVALGWLPVGGREGAGAVVLPALTLGLSSAATLARVLRASLLETLRADFIRTARAKGLRERTVILRHALPGALLPVVTIAGVVFGHLLGGAVIVEQIFAWPGLGRLLVDSIYDRDYPMLQGFVIFLGTIFTVVNWVVDGACWQLDPRLRRTLKKAAR